MYVLSINNYWAHNKSELSLVFISHGLPPFYILGENVFITATGGTFKLFPLWLKLPLEEYLNKLFTIKNYFCWYFLLLLKNRTTFMPPFELTEH